MGDLELICHRFEGTWCRLEVDLTSYVTTWGGGDGHFGEMAKMCSGGQI